jgi:hypothetical protein
MLSTLIEWQANLSLETVYASALFAFAGVGGIVLLVTSTKKQKPMAVRVKRRR